ncbi:PAS domain-containing protein [Ehrlichia ruminantium]|uniref:PAS domain-containing protein n=1 Tax=Ehrlichia ruminantium TaxID=779 RepID=A0AAE6UIJ6_EHRRU|nr:PAS domain-containing protein [Ehrlichia ruminantium]QGR02708.1 PAS domain-containing protein [Ehrlichia ruminantium]QGR03629.1 PAS domain-containing protein [Ehrlichia ruminantium]QGR04556.1 PAS domain-containing protein [Ehrlichia ruminantium]
MPEYVSERRAIKILFSYWNELRADKAFPSIEEIDPEEITDIWPYCFIIEVRENSEEKYHCTYIGEAAKDLYKSDIKVYAESQNIKLFFPQVIENLFDYLESVLENQEPIIDESETEGADGNYIKIRECLLPLGNNGKITHIIGVIGGRIYY